MNEKDFEKEKTRRHQMHQLDALVANETRAQGLTVGSAGGGVIDIIMRTHSGKFMWQVFQPEEIATIIHQLAASINCRASITPLDKLVCSPTKPEKENVATKKAVNKRSAK